MNTIRCTETATARNVNQDESFRASSNFAYQPQRTIELPPIQETAKTSSSQNSPKGEIKAAMTKPKRARTAYNIFFKMQQEKLNTARRNGERVVTTAAAISDHWKSLTASQRTLYFQLAIEDKFRYYKAKNDYEKFLDRQRKERQAGGQMIGKTLDLPTPEEIHTADESTNMVPDEQRLPEDTTQDTEDTVPPYSRQSIALLASKLDEASIDFIIKALK